MWLRESSMHPFLCTKEDSANGASRSLQSIPSNNVKGTPRRVVFESLLGLLSLDGLSRASESDFNEWS